MDLSSLLENVKNGSASVEDALEQLKTLPYEDIGFAKLDHHRTLRRGTGEVVYCAGKTPVQTGEIFEKLSVSGSVLGTRAENEHYQAVAKLLPSASYHPASKTIVYCSKKPPEIGLVAVASGGTADIPVAEEAAITAEFFGAKVLRIYDVGIAGIHRLFQNLPLFQSCNAIVAVAGMEGALPGVIAGLVDLPVIAVPTSVGYGANFAGLAPLLTMLNTCAEGVSVVNIDNGFGAGYLAAQINRLTVKGGNTK